VLEIIEWDQFVGDLNTSVSKAPLGYYLRTICPLPNAEITAYIKHVVHFMAKMQMLIHISVGEKHSVFFIYTLILIFRHLFLVPYAL
jgi:hypothetical protein